MGTIWEAYGKHCDARLVHIVADGFITCQNPKTDKVIQGEGDVMPLYPVVPCPQVGDPCTWMVMGKKSLNLGRSRNQKDNTKCTKHAFKKHAQVDALKLDIIRSLLRAASLKVQPFKTASYLGSSTPAVDTVRLPRAMQHEGANV